MLVMLAYDTPEQRHQNFLRKEFERVGGTRVQYSIYLFNGEPHECERVIRYMQRVATGIPGDIRLFPMENSTWEAQVIITECVESARRVVELMEFVKVW
ncbi:MAG: CRISPR-associated endonuclease Cas2 [Verrucomicrobiota bacterium]|jgi:CRISPR-associated endonuclease Cas2